ncbi:MAG: hypothetical protein WCE64_12645 [Bacteroidales bacterium]
MKLLVFILLLYFFCAGSLFSQILGNGTAGNPYHGTAITNETWNASHPDYPLWQWDEWGNKVIYVCRNATGYRSLIINSGVTVTLGAGFALLVQGSRYDQSIITINSSGVFAIEPGAYAKTFSIVNNGIIRLRSDEYGIPSLNLMSQFMATYSGSGLIEETMFLSGGITGAGGYRWHYISSPIDGTSSSVFTSNPSTLNLVQYVESLAQSDNRVGWIAYDGYVYRTNDYNYGYAFGSLSLGKGYNYYCSTNATRTFSGIFSNSDLDISLTCGSGYPDSQGYNLIGNPFTAVLDWDFMTDLYGIPEEVDNAIYFTVDDGFASYVNKVASGGATEYGSIPPMQGFFVHVNTPTSGISMTIPVDACTIDPYQYRYKGIKEADKRTSTIPLVRIKLESKKDSDDLVVRFDEKATNLFDKKFDAYKFSKTSKSLGTWTKTENIDYSINGLPFPETSVQVPVGIYTSSPGVFELSTNELKNLDNYTVTLKDLKTNITIDLKKGGILLFDSPGGIIEDRFILTISNLTTSIPEVTVPSKKFIVYSSSGDIKILSLTDEFNNCRGSVTFYDLTGRKITQQNNFIWNGNGELKQINLGPMNKGLLFVEIKAGNKKYVEKVNINN